MKYLLVFLFLSSIHLFANAQKVNPIDYYYQIPETPTEYTATNTVARMVDGLGFRYYWASEGLRPEDLAYKPSEEARTIEETLDHILSLSTVIINSVTNRPNIRPVEAVEWKEKRLAQPDRLVRNPPLREVSANWLTEGVIIQTPEKNVQS